MWRGHIGLRLCGCFGRRFDGASGFVAASRAMIRTIITLAAIFAVTSPALAQNPDHPHRDWGKVATLDMPLIEATSCIGRELNRAGDAMIVPVEGGNDIDWTAHVPWGKKMEPWMTFQLRGADDRTIPLSSPDRPGARQQGHREDAKALPENRRHRAHAVKTCHSARLLRVPALCCKVPSHWNRPDAGNRSAGPWHCRL
jgi:hypothetical protein